MAGNFICDFISLQYMLQTAHPYAKAFHRTQENEYFILTVGMAVNKPFPSNDFKDRI